MINPMQVCQETDQMLAEAESREHINFNECTEEQFQEIIELIDSTQIRSIKCVQLSNLSEKREGTLKTLLFFSTLANAVFAWMIFF